MFKKLMVLGTGDPCLLKSHTKRETINYHEFLMDNHPTINEVVSLGGKKKTDPDCDEVDVSND